MNTSTPELPALSEETIARIEQSVFTTIAEERASAHADAEPKDARAARSRARRRGWLTASGVAAAFVVGAVVSPALITASTGSLMSAGSASSESAIAPKLEGATMPEGLTLLDSTADMSAASPEAPREMITSASATVRVDDIQKSAEEIAALAIRQGGFVESKNIGSSGVVADQSMPAPRTDDYAWISIRVPSDTLNETITELEKTGEVIASSSNATDVTATAIDLRARVEATRASVQRLTELMAQTGTVGELIEAEVALTDRQAQLESYEQQLADLETQVAMSSLQVELTRTATVTEPDPAGFGDGLFAGWNGLLVTLNALVVAFGFLLPWLGVGAVAALIVWAIVRTRRARRTHAAPAGPAAPAE
ncbi:DUF4349 domain-containing protein [Microbacterium keratanolyticum]|uniref:DUF4349 domain-containing protein n=2 Tax=Microbacterium keratanolyticum TaxID=67574 RepID=UPI00366CA6D9